MKGFQITKFVLIFTPLPVLVKTKRDKKLGMRKGERVTFNEEFSFRKENFNFRYNL